ncbi:MAG: TrbG/VirB9 family P-type conjugative transfer protein [Sphingomonadales bacterium]|nr:TrbG/VirB9 family P-type conjugative transfer protein [Sphingomonadales bacterium]
MSRAAKWIGCLAVTVLAILPVMANAAVTPTLGDKDPRIQTVSYDPAQVVQLKVVLGYTLVVEFGTDEQVRNVAVGNSAVWQVTANQAADHIFIKPLQGAVSTNLVVVTDSRLYNFELEATTFTGLNQAYTIRFEYPAEASPDAKPTSSQVIYKFTGSRSLRPSDIYDDGKFTYLDWPQNAKLPAIFIVNSEGKEALINGAVRNGHYVIEGVGQRLVFRLGKAEAEAIRRLVKTP